MKISRREPSTKMSKFRNSVVAAASGSGWLDLVGRLGLLEQLR